MALAILSITSVLYYTYNFFDLFAERYNFAQAIKAENKNKAINTANKLRTYSIFGINLKDVNTLYNLAYYSLQKETQDYGDKSKYFSKILVDSNKFLLTSFEKEYFKNIKSKLDNTGLEIANNFLRLLKNNENILFLVEDSSTLNPNGGKIVSYVLVANNGKITSTFGTIEQVENKLEEKDLVKVPNKYDIFFTEKYLRPEDIGILTDVKERDEVAFKYFEKALDKKIDTIIYTNEDFIKNALAISGPIYLNELKKEISANTYNKEIAAQNNSVKVLGAKTIGSIDLSNISPEQIANNLEEAVTNKHFLIGTKDQELQQYANKLGLGKTTPNIESNYDYIYFIENNTGNNTLTDYLQKEIDYSYKESNTELKIKFKNVYEGHVDSIYNGIFQLILPKDILINKFSLVQDNKEINLIRSIKTNDFEGKFLIEVPIFIDPKEDNELVLDYTNAIDRTGLYIQKQPGAKPINFNIEAKDLTKTVLLDKDIKLRF